MFNTSGDDTDSSGSEMDYGKWEPAVKPGFPESCICGAKMVVPYTFARPRFICENGLDEENREMHYVKWWDDCAQEEIEEIKKKLEIYQLKHAYTHQDRISKLEDEVAALKEEVAFWMKGFVDKVDEIEQTEIVSRKLKDIHCDSADYKGKSKLPQYK